MVSIKVTEIWQSPFIEVNWDQEIHIRMVLEQAKL
jgi:hypothetical protein